MRAVERSPSVRVLRATVILSLFAAFSGVVWLLLGHGSEPAGVEADSSAGASVVSPAEETLKPAAAGRTAPDSPPARQPAPATASPGADPINWCMIGIVRDEEAAPIPEANVWVSRQATRPLSTDRQGRFVFGDGEWQTFQDLDRVLIQHPGFLPESHAVNLPANFLTIKKATVEFTLRSGFPVRVRVIDDSWSPVPGARVSLRKVGGGASPMPVESLKEWDRMVIRLQQGGNPLSVSVTDPDGMAELRVVPGSHYAFAWKPGYVWRRDYRLVFDLRSANQFHEIVLARGRCLAGEVVDEQGGSVEEALIVVESSGEGEFVPSAATSDALGRFEVCGIVSGAETVNMIVTHPDFALAARPNLDVGAHVTVVLLKGATARLLLIDEETRESVEGLVSIRVVPPPRTSQALRIHWLVYDLHSGWSMSVLQGEVDLPLFPDSAEMIEVIAAGWLPAFVPASPDSEMFTGRQVVQLRRARTFRINITDSNGDHPTGVEVRYLVSTFDPTGNLMREVSGKARMEKVEGREQFVLTSRDFTVSDEVHLTVRHPDYQDQELRFKVPGRWPPELQTVTLVLM